MSDRITLTGLRVFAHHGVFDHERRDGQEFVIDLTVNLDLLAAARSDDVADTVHYGELAEAVHRAVATDPVDLIETVAERVAIVALGYPAVTRAEVTVHKPHAPLPVPIDDVAVTIVREPARQRAVVALGSNLGDRSGTLDAAVADLRALPRTRVVAVSPWHDSVALTPSGPDPDAPGYLNGVALLDTALTPHELLAHLLRIELAHGRDRRLGAPRWSDRTLDLDVISMGSLVLDDDALTLPHPRAHERDFVLRPWLEVDPAARIPGRGLVVDLVRALDAEGSR